MNAFPALKNFKMTSYNVPKTMKALIKRTEVEGYEYTDIPVPEPEGDEVLIKVHAMKTDISFYLRHHMYTCKDWERRDLCAKTSNVYSVLLSVTIIYGHTSAFTFAI